MDHPPLQTGCYYHIYNRTNGSDVMFPQADDFQRFLRLYDKYISPVADTYAWVLMVNHFHILVRIKEGMAYKYSKADFQNPTHQMPTGPGDAVGFGANALRFDDVKWETVEASGKADLSTSANAEDGTNQSRKPKIPNPTNHFSHFYNAYAKYINAKYGRHGSLFQRPFRRKSIEDDGYLRQLILYIHNNPVHHGLVSHPAEYEWSSYHTCFSSGATKLQRAEVLEWFGGLENFKEVHEEYSAAKMEEIDKWLEESE